MPLRSGSYQVGKPIVRISSIRPVFRVLASKQKPRRLAMLGDDGKDHLFLLKGHEDCELLPCYASAP